MKSTLIIYMQNSSRHHYRAVLNLQWYHWYDAFLMINLLQELLYVIYTQCYLLSVVILTINPVEQSTSY